MGVVSEGLVEWGTFTDAAFDQVAILLAAEREKVRFDGNQQFLRSLWELAEDGLTANDDEFRSAGDARSRSEDVLKLVTLHVRVRFGVWSPIPSWVGEHLRMGSSAGAAVPRRSRRTESHRPRRGGVRGSPSTRNSIATGQGCPRFGHTIGLDSLAQHRVGVVMPEASLPPALPVPS